MLTAILNAHPWSYIQLHEKRRESRKYKEERKTEYNSTVNSQLIRTKKITLSNCPRCQHGFVLLLSAFKSLKQRHVKQAKSLEPCFKKLAKISAKMKLTVWSLIAMKTLTNHGRRQFQGYLKAPQYIISSCAASHKLRGIFNYLDTRYEWAQQKLPFVRAGPT